MKTKMYLVLCAMMTLTIAGCSSNDGDEELDGNVPETEEPAQVDPLHFTIDERTKSGPDTVFEGYIFDLNWAGMLAVYITKPDQTEEEQDQAIRNKIPFAGYYNYLFTMLHIYKADYPDINFDSVVKDLSGLSVKFKIRYYRYIPDIFGESHDFYSLIEILETNGIKENVIPLRIDEETGEYYFFKD